MDSRVWWMNLYPLVPGPHIGTAIIILFWWACSVFCVFVSSFLPWLTVHLTAGSWEGQGSLGQEEGSWEEDSCGLGQDWSRSCQEKCELLFLPMRPLETCIIILALRHDIIDTLKYYVHVVAKCVYTWHFIQNHMCMTIWELEGF